MGYMIHTAIIVTCGHDDVMTKAYATAVEVFGINGVTERISSGCNGYVSFLIPPDGSKEGWDDSRKSDRRRRRYMEWCQEMAYIDGSNTIEAIEVTYCGDSGEAYIDEVTGKESLHTYDLSAVQCLEDRVDLLEETLKAIRGLDCKEQINKLITENLMSDEEDDV